MSSRTRTLLIVNGALLLLLIGFGLALAVVDRKDTPPSDTTAPSASVSTSPEETAVTVGIICTSPRDATDTLVGAWIAGEAAAAARCAEEPVVDELFENDGTGAQWIFQGCGIVGPDRCQYSYEGGGVTFTVAGSDADGWKVTAVEFIAD